MVGMGMKVSLVRLALEAVNNSSLDEAMDEYYILLEEEKDN